MVYIQKRKNVIACDRQYAVLVPDRRDDRVTSQELHTVPAGINDSWRRLSVSMAFN